MQKYNGHNGQPVYIDILDHAMRCNWCPRDASYTVDRYLLCSGRYVVDCACEQCANEWLSGTPYDTLDQAVQATVNHLEAMEVQS